MKKYSCIHAEIISPYLVLAYNILIWQNSCGFICLCRNINVYSQTKVLFGSLNLLTKNTHTDEEVQF